MRPLLWAAGLLAIPMSCLAQQNGITVENAWSRAAAAGRTGVVYLTITDAGAADRLTGVASPVAARVDLHESFIDNGVSKMRDVAALPVEPGKPVMLAPGGYHIMLTGLKQTLKQGDTFPLTLSFQNSGQITATVTVQSAGGGAPMGHDSMGGMNMPGMPMHNGGTTGKTPQ
jgi:periplasmic copper chaperone A